MSEQYEDWQLDESFQVESASEFLGGLSPDEEDFALRTMVPCANCGEWRPKTDESIRRTHLCYLCSLDDAHKTKRGGTTNASKNGLSLAHLVERLERAVERHTDDGDAS
jgi:hypothetical protein